MINFICQLDWATGCWNLSVQLLSCVQLFVTPWTAACQASLSITNSQSLLKLMSIESVMPSNRLILCCPFLLLPSIFSSIRVFSSESVLHIRWPKYWSFASASVLPMNIQDWFPLGLTGLISLSNITLNVSVRVFWIRLTCRSADWIKQIALLKWNGLHLISWRLK